MAFNIVSGGVVRFVAYYTYPGQVATNKRDYQCILLTGGLVIGSDDVLAQLDSDWATQIKPLMTSDADYYGSQLYYQTPVGAPPRPSSTKASAGPGSDAGEALPLQTAGLVSLYTDTLGKTGQGRIYTPFPSIDSQGTDSTPDALFLADLANFRDYLIAPLVVTAGGVTATFVPVLYLPGGVPPKQIVSGIARDAWATQRRRGNFGRVNSNPF